MKIFEMVAFSFSRIYFPLQAYHVAVKFLIQFSGMRTTALKHPQRNGEVPTDLQKAYRAPNRQRPKLSETIHRSHCLLTLFTTDGDYARRSSVDFD